MVRVVLYLMLAWLGACSENVSPQPSRACHGDDCAGGSADGPDGDGLPSEDGARRAEEHVAGEAQRIAGRPVTPGHRVKGGDSSIDRPASGLAPGGVDGMFAEGMNSGGMPTMGGVSGGVRYGGASASSPVLEGGLTSGAPSDTPSVLAGGRPARGDSEGGIPAGGIPAGGIPAGEMPMAAGAFGGETAPSGHPCQTVQDILNAHCTGCHGDFATDGLDLRAIDQMNGRVSRHTSRALIVPGNGRQSYLIQKILGTHEAVGGPGVLMPPGQALDADDLETLIAWIDSGARCQNEPIDEPEGAEYDPNTIDQETLFRCDGPALSSTIRLRRIDKLQLRRRVGLDRDTPLAANPFEVPGASQYSTYADRASIDVATLDLYLDMLPYTASPWIGEQSWDRMANQARSNEHRCIYDDAFPDRECVHHFARDYMRHGVVHLTASDAEIDRLTDFAMDILADEAMQQTTRENSLAVILGAAWLHTGAIFDGEFGVGPVDEAGRRQLSPLEMAEWVGNLLSSRGVGATSIHRYDNDLSGDQRWTDGQRPHLASVLNAADDGTISDPEVVRRLVREHAMGIDADRPDEWIDYGTHSLHQRRDRSAEWMADRLDQFFLEWFAVGQFASKFQEKPNATTRWNDESAGLFQRALDGMRSFSGWLEPDGLMVFTDTVARVVTDDQDVLRRLLTTNDWYISAPNTDMDISYRLYGLDDPVEATQEGRWTTLPMTERMGLLTHPVWLSAHGDAFEDGPSLIYRGKWVREKLFCQTVPPLELVNVQAMLPAGDGTQSARARIESTIETQAECMGCHQFMNSLGKPFEFYNHAGGVRTSDHGDLPDGSTVVSNAPDPALNRAYADPMTYISALADNEHVKRCFIRHTFRYFVARDETMDDACVLTAMESAYDESGGSFVSMLEVLATHESLVTRVRGEDAP
ncbi:MAG: DUF1588 domain-containing protein [Myxococcota bacterium]|nr:DUF1588 domain-containing protein [Myxococcota bacterium]